MCAAIREALFSLPPFHLTPLTIYHSSSLIQKLQTWQEGPKREKTQKTESTPVSEKLRSAPGVKYQLLCYPNASSKLGSKTV